MTFAHPAALASIESNITRLWLDVKLGGQQGQPTTTPPGTGPRTDRLASRINEESMNVDKKVSRASVPWTM